MQTVVEDETIISKRTDEFVSSARLIEVYGHLREANLIFPTIPQAANRPRLFKSSNFQANRVPSPSLTRLSASLVRNTNMYTFVSSSSLHSMKNHTRIDSWVCNFGMAYCILTSQYDVSSKAEQILVEMLYESLCGSEELGVVLFCVLFAHAVSVSANRLQHTTMGETFGMTLQMHLDSIGAWINTPRWRSSLQNHKMAFIGERVARILMDDDGVIFLMHFIYVYLCIC